MEGLYGINVYLQTESSSDTTSEIEMTLDKVPQADGNTSNADSTKAFVKLGSGNLTEESYEALTKNNESSKFQKVARVLITIEALESETTPLYNGGSSQ